MQLFRTSSKNDIYLNLLPKQKASKASLFSMLNKGHLQK